jgi:isoleucyl-tRNA synthetase
MFEKPIFRPSFPELEKETLKWWLDSDNLKQAIASRPDDQVKAFYDGPITANGAPHHGHMLTFALKDIYPRYWTMKGYRVARSIGWDCQGLPVEYEIEKKLGFQEKKEIEEYGVDKFNALCRESVLNHRSGIIDLELRMGRLTNEEEEYATMDRDYIESIWWSLAELHKKGLLYEGFKVVPYSTRAGTTLSNAEVASGGYEPFEDPAITVEFPLVQDESVRVLAWTTTPWTMPGNMGLAVGKEILYSYVKLSEGEKTYIVASDLVTSLFGQEGYEIVKEVPGSELVGKSYVPPFDFYAGRENAHKVYEGFHVTTDSGTGIVHLAPYGAEDNEIFQQVGIESFDYLDDQGDFTDDVPTYAGMFYRDANEKIIEDLKKKDRLFKSEKYVHDMPMCWRTKTPLIYKPITAWYVAMSQLRGELVANNETVEWMPGHVKKGRFGNWLAEIKDWGISRTRYWGTPLPIWKSESGKVKIIGSYAELKELAGVDVDDPHRPFIDDVKFTLDGEEYRRIPDVLDVWYDSGAMPFARFHYPFENKEKFEAKFPAEYIAEGVDQTRGWFYSLMAISTALFGKAPYKQVVVNGMVLADDGQKLSKSKKNYSAPDELLDQFGADATRLNFFSTPIVSGEDTTVSEQTLKITVQEYLLPIWNMYSFMVMYANLHDWSPTAQSVDLNNMDETSGHAMDQWIKTRYKETVIKYTQLMDEYKIAEATREMKKFMDEDLSKWYIRSSRGRFVEGQESALETLYQCLVGLLHLYAPMAPFLSEYLYQRLVIDAKVEAPESLHLSYLPEYTNFENKKLLKEMTALREWVDAGFRLRESAQIKVRQPLAVVMIDSEVELTDWMKEILQAELNVKMADSVEVIPSNDYVLVENQKSWSVGLDAKLTPELREEGLVRDLTRNLQMVRKKARLSLEQKVQMELDVSRDLKDVFEKHYETIKEPVGIAEYTLVPLEKKDEGVFEQKVEGEKIRVRVTVVE